MGDHQPAGWCCANSPGNCRDGWTITADFLLCVNLSVRNWAMAPGRGGCWIAISRSDPVFVIAIKGVPGTAGELRGRREPCSAGEGGDADRHRRLRRRLLRFHARLRAATLPAQDRSGLVRRAAAATEGVAFLTAAASVAASLNCDCDGGRGWGRWPKPGGHTVGRAVRAVIGTASPARIEAFLESSVSCL